MTLVLQIRCVKIVTENIPPYHECCTGTHLFIMPCRCVTAYWRLQASLIQTIIHTYMIQHHLPSVYQLCKHSLTRYSLKKLQIFFLSRTMCPILETSFIQTIIHTYIIQHHQSAGYWICKHSLTRYSLAKLKICFVSYVSWNGINQEGMLQQNLFLPMLIDHLQYLTVS